jgi:hypothetical protein
MQDKISQEEKRFCELYCNGAAPYAGNASRCYAKVFVGAYDEDDLDSPIKARELLMKPEIQSYLETLEKQAYADSNYVKRYLTGTLMRIIDEASSASFKDRFNTQLSPAPLRSVAVSASKALADLYPVKESQKHELSIDGNGGAPGQSGVTFNIIMPEKKEGAEE